MVEQFALKFKEVDLAQQFETHLRCLDSFSDWQLLKLKPLFVSMFQGLRKLSTMQR